MRSPHHGSHAGVPALAPDTAPRRAYGRLALLVVAAAISACSDSAIPTSSTLSAPGAISASSTRDERASAPATLTWQDTARKLVSAHPAAFSPIVAARAYALLGIAQYGAAVASDQALGITGDDDALATGADDGGRAQYESRRGAIGEASRVVLAALFPDAAAALQTQLDAESVGPNGRTHPQFTRGVDIGHAMGLVMTGWAGNDGFTAQWDSVAFAKNPLAPGVWFQAAPKVSPAGYQFPAMRPYFMTSPWQFRPAPPPTFGTGAFTTALEALRGVVAARTHVQDSIANYWNLPQGTPTALGHWTSTAAALIVEHRLGDRSASHILALANAAAMDATIGCWDAKYSYLLLRPFQNAGGVGPNGTVFPTPNHPSYPSGHSCVSAAAAVVLEQFFPEKTTQLEADVAQAGLSREYAGIHYHFDVVAGQELGRSAAAWALNYDRTRGLLRAVGR
jgi:membrane-associated phospholipid phosphatase